MHKSQSSLKKNDKYTHGDNTAWTVHRKAEQLDVPHYRKKSQNRKRILDFHQHSLQLFELLYLLIEASLLEFRDLVEFIGSVDMFGDF
jgi:hypothetical protein